MSQWNGMSESAYCLFSRGDASGIALHADRDTAIPALLERAGCQPVDALGRGALFRFGTAHGPAILREYRRGGAMQKLLREGTLTNRPKQEWDILTRLHEAGFPVPQPVGVIWRLHQMCYTGAIATRQVDGVDLIAYLRGAPADREATLVEAGRAIRRMHDLDVFHADLHVGNLLAAPDGASTKVHVIDFDKARVTKLTDIERARNLLRLRRSFLKHALRLTDFERILRGYGMLAWPRWLEFFYDVRSQYSDSISAGKHAH